jgi:branched-chain amino acid transport system permease protein
VAERETRDGLAGRRRRGLAADDALTAVDNFLQHLASGLLTGGVLALLASGLALIFGVMGMVNFAQGDFVMLGMYAVFITAGALALPGALVSILLLPAFLAFGWLLHRGLVGRLAAPREAAMAQGHDSQLLLTLGLSLICQNGALLVFGADPRGGGAARDAIRVAGLVLDPDRVLASAVALIATAGLFVMLTRTNTGRSMRAAAADPVAAQYCGIDVPRAHRTAFSIGAGLAGVGGGLLSGFYPIQPFVSLDFIVLMFAAVVLGGLGSIAGACVGGLLIGVVQGLGQLVVPLQLQSLSVFGVFLLVLFVRPQGLFGKAVRV